MARPHAASGLTGLMDVGSRHGGDFGKFAGRGNSARGRAVGSAIGELHDAVSKKAAKVVVGTAVGVLAASNPAIATLVLAYKVSKALYKVSSKAYDAYERTHDPNDAARAAAGEMVHVGIGEARDQVIGKIVDVGWTGIKAASDIHTDAMEDKIFTNAAKSTLNEVLPK